MDKEFDKETSELKSINIENMLRMKSQFENTHKFLKHMETHLGCLSCSEVSSDSLMLICGHSICLKVSSHIINIL
jgi:hypothetical protein